MAEKTSADKDLKYIKKHYSEKLSHVCRDLFPTLLETPGLLPRVLDSKFDKSAMLGDDLSSQSAKDDFKDFIYSFVDVEKPVPEIVGDKDAFKLMEEAGYKLCPECLSEEDIQSFRKYYYRNGPTPVYAGGKPEKRSGEEICTFNGGRLQSCRVWFAIKEGAEELRREDFASPTRQDEYGTSVISIQFTRGDKPTLSIKNRYNHSVNNPDATFSNNLENITPGLTQAFAKSFSIVLNSEEEAKLGLSQFVMATDGRYYRRNCEDYANFRSYCENNVIIDNGTAVKLSSDYMLLDDNIFDLKNNRVITYNTYKQEQRIGEMVEQHEGENSFIDSLGKITKFEITKGDNKERILTIKKESGEDVILTFGRHNEVLDVHDPNITEIKDNYLAYSRNFRSLSAPNAVKIGDAVICGSDRIASLNLPNVEVIGNSFARSQNLKVIDMPKLREIGDWTFQSSVAEQINVPNLEKMGNYCFSNIYSVRTTANEIFTAIREEGQEELFMANPQSFLMAMAEGDESSLDLFKNITQNPVTVFNAPKLTQMGSNCFKQNDLVEFNAPLLQNVGENCFETTSISSFNCGEGVEMPSQQTFSVEDEKLFDCCVDAVMTAQRRLLGIEEPSQDDVAEQVDTQTQPQTASIEVTTGMEKASAVVSAQQFDIEHLTEDAKRDLEEFIKLENGAGNDMAQDNEMQE